METTAEPVILLVEDLAPDVMIFKEALARLDAPFRLMVVNDGKVAIQYLSGTQDFADRTAFPLPNLVLLDLNLPVFDGFHVLEWLRTEPTLRAIPVVILAASNATEDINRAYAFGANSFITKSPSLPKLTADLKIAFAHWLGKASPMPPPDVLDSQSPTSPTTQPRVT